MELAELGLKKMKRNRVAFVVREVVCKRIATRSLRLRPREKKRNDGVAVCNFYVYNPNSTFFFLYSNSNFQGGVIVK